MKPFDALIVGAGPAGSTAAILLARAGWRVAIVEKAAFPRRKVCGEYISGAAWPLLAELGVAARVAALAGPEVRRVGLFADEASWTRRCPQGALAGRSGREHLDTILVERAASCGAKCARAGCDADRRRALRANGDRRSRRVGARRAPDAAGARERRGRAISSVSRRTFAARGSRGPDAARALSRRLRRHGLPTHGRVSLSCCVTPRCAGAARARGRGARAAKRSLAHIVAANRGMRERSTGEARGRVAFAGPIRPAIRRFDAQGVFAVGNTAGEAHPIIAEGISMAIQSSFLLCERLLAAGRDRRARSTTSRAIRRAWRRNFAARTRAAAASPRS
jgi:2-polyprenyl-6-methoxyphenol hydroxylase-like FAD-dependent oxidoreductase